MKHTINLILTEDDYNAVQQAKEKLCAPSMSEAIRYLVRYCAKTNHNIPPIPRKGTKTTWPRYATYETYLSVCLQNSFTDYMFTKEQWQACQSIQLDAPDGSNPLIDVDPEQPARKFIKMLG